MAITDGATRPEESSPVDENRTPLPAGPFFHRIDWISCGITTVATFGIYLATIAPEVTLEDGGTFITGAAYAGVPDCPGFALWTLYSWVFVKLIPFSNIAWRVTVGSALAAALACGLTALMVSRGGAMMLEETPAFANRTITEQSLLRILCGFVAGLALGFCEAIWSQVARLNIWAMSTLLFAVLLALLMRWTAAPHRKRFLYAAVFVFGLLLTNSQSLIAVAPAIVLWVMASDSELGRDLFLAAALLALIQETTGCFPFFAFFSHQNVPLLIAFVSVAIGAVVTGVKSRRIGSEWKPALACGGLFLAGLGLYFYSPLASMTNPPFNWAYPRTVEGFYHLVTRGQYAQLSPTHNFGLFTSQLRVIGLETVRQYGWYYLVFIPAPFFLLHGKQRSNRHWMLGLISAFVCTGPVMVAMLNPSRDRNSLGVIEPFFSTMYVVLAVWTGLGLMIIGSKISKVQHHA